MIEERFTLPGLRYRVEQRIEKQKPPPLEMRRGVFAC
jgi:hypothetical protein